MPETYKPGERVECYLPLTGRWLPAEFAGETSSATWGESFKRLNVRDLTGHLLVDLHPDAVRHFGEAKGIDWDWKDERRFVIHPSRKKRGSFLCIITARTPRHALRVARSIFSCLQRDAYAAAA
jgi:hypothetical protein